jgi:hypothetical protein
MVSGDGLLERPLGCHGRGRRLAALFREAWRRQRRRRQRLLAVLLVVIAIVAVVVVRAKGSGSSAAGRVSPIASSVSSILLPRSGDFFSLSTSNGHLLLSGGPAGSLLPSGTRTALVHGRVAQRCDGAVLNSRTLRIGHLRRANCANPTLYGERVLPIVALAGTTKDGIGRFAVRIATASPAARDGYVLGPVLMTFPQISSTDAQWVYGDGSLWVFATSVDGSTTEGELVRVSLTSGRLLQHWTMPALDRALLAVDEDGLWIAPSIYSGTPEHPTASQRVRYETLYRIAPGASAPQAVTLLGPSGAQWLAANDHTVWLDFMSGTRGQLWKLTSTHRATATPLIAAPSESELGEGPASVVAGSGAGVYDVISGLHTQRILQTSGATLHQSVLTSLRPPTTTNSQQPSVLVDNGTLYVLDPPTLSFTGTAGKTTVDGVGDLFRITPAQR